MGKFIVSNTVILSLYALLIVGMGGATVIEKLYSTESAAEAVYGSWWFISLWSILSLLSMLYLIEKKVHKRLAVMLLHVSFIVILVGALVTHMTAENGTIHLRKGVSVSFFSDKEHLSHQLPFAMTLKDFEVLHYKGSDAVMDYCCTINVTNEAEAVRDSQISVSMNNIGKVDGYRFYQSAYDSDNEGTLLLVVHDPYGIAITYIGYVLLLVSLLWTMFSRHTRIRSLYRLATKPVVMVLWLLTMTFHAEAQVKPAHIHEDIADQLGEVAVLYHGRICPLNTAATEFVTKLCGKSRWQGYSANEIFVSWMIYYTEWETQKIIRVKNAEVQKLLGIDSQWASVRDFYARANEYKLSGLANDQNIDAATRKAILETEEKLQVITMFYNSEMLHIFPLSVDGRLDWYAPGSTELPLGTPEAEFQFINHAMDHLTQSILVSDVANAEKVIAKIRLYQREKAAHVLPSNATLKTEIVYNKLQSANWVVYACLLLSLVFCVLVLAMPYPAKSSKRLKAIALLHTLFFICQLTFLSVLVVLRWWISGHAPMSNGFETMLFMAWVTLVITLVAMQKIPVLKALGPVVSAFCMLVATLAVGNPQVTPLMPVLQSPLLTIHVALVMISYALFAILTLLAIYGLILHRKDKRYTQSAATQSSLGESRQELERITALSQLLLYPAVALLAAGIFIGAVWANISWGTYWSWDPKETWALITLMIYAIGLHRSFGLTSSPVRYHAYILWSFLTVLMTYFGVNYLLSGMHSYA